MSATMAAPARIRLYWKPGCSSCLRTKEFLTKQQIAFESVNAENNPQALAQLKALGARGLPVISLGNRFTLCQSFADVLKFLDLKMRLADPLPGPELFSKLDTVLAAAARITRQFPAGQLGETFRDRNRTKRGQRRNQFLKRRGNNARMANRRASKAVASMKASCHGWQNTAGSPFIPVGLTLAAPRKKA